MRNMTPSHRDPERKAVLQLYAMLAAALVLTIVPNMLAAGIALVLFFSGLIAAYVLRGRCAAGSLQENHCTYIIRTLWISGFFTLFTMTIASAYMLPRIDNAPLQPCIDGVMANAERLQSAGIAELSAVLQPCMGGYVQANYNVLMISMLIGAGPVLLYFLYRFMRGFSRALGGYRMARPKSWL